MNGDWIDEPTETLLEIAPAEEPSPVLWLLSCGERGLLDPPPCVPLRPGVTSIGRTGDDGVTLRDRCLSRLHATVHFDPGTRSIRIVDGRSRNGTFVNGRRVDRACVRDGDLLRVGGSFLLVRWRPGGPSDTPCDEILGSSPAIVALRGTIGQVARSPAMVLLVGETGTGKELAARALHRLSRRSGPLVAINCSAIPESLAESQLFGHVTGAFTGASAQPGYFRAAHGGTLFLDEVADLSPATQPRLLRALEEHVVLPVGSVMPVPCDVRVIAAINRNPVDEVRAGRLRGDLYARLAEVILRLPPLRERREDIPMLLSHALGRPLPPLSTRLLEALLLHLWPYNVRELMKLAAELLLRGAGVPVLDVGLVAERLGLAGDINEAGGEERALPRRTDVEAMLLTYRGNVSEAARVLGFSRRQIYRWMQECGVTARAFRRAR